MQEFQSLNKEEKIDFFIKCQELLIKHHPTSEFAFTYANVKDRLFFALDFYKKYKGYVYYNDNVCLLVNKVRVEDPRNPVKVIKEHTYRPPHPEYNAYSIDFVVFRKLMDCLDFCRAEYTPQIQYILFVKNNEVKLYPTERFLNKLTNIPLVAFL